jgi:hypothetical protein
MSRKIINVGSADAQTIIRAVPGNGEPLRDALIKVNDNFEEIYNVIDAIELPDISNLATETYVDEAVAAIELPDISNLATETYVDEAVAAIELPVDLSDLADNNNLLSIKDFIEVTKRISFVPDSEVVFEKTLGVSEIDFIDTDVAFTRSIASIDLGISAGGIYNIAIEESHNQLTSPAGTLWNGDGWNNLDNVRSRTYTPLRETLKGQGNFRKNILNTDLVMWDTINNKYYTFRFFRWDQGAQHDGGFGYTRNLLNTEQQLGITFADGSVQYSALNGLTKYPQTYVGNTSGFEIRPQEAGHHIYVTGQNLALPNDRELPLPIGTIIKIVTGPVDELNPNLTTIVPKTYVGESSATIVKQFIDDNEPCVLPEKSICQLLKIANNRWQLSGVPTGLSFFENDSNFITAQDIPSIPGPYIDDNEAAAAGVAIGNPYHKTGTGGQVFVRLS